MSDNNLVKTTLLSLKFSNWLFGDSSFKDVCKKIDEIEQFFENNPEIKILFEEFVEEVVLVYIQTFYKAAKHLEDEK